MQTNRCLFFSQRRHVSCSAGEAIKEERAAAAGFYRKKNPRYNSAGVKRQCHFAELIEHLSVDGLVRRIWDKIVLLLISFRRLQAGCTYWVRHQLTIY